MAIKDVRTARDTTGPSQSHLRGYINVWHVLVLAKERKVEKNSQRARVGGEDD
jgi:hypothetical protein